MQTGGMETVEKLLQLETIRSCTSQNSRSGMSGTYKDKGTVNQTLVGTSLSVTFYVNVTERAL